MQQENFQISKSRVSNSDGGKTIRFDLSCGGYVNADNKVALTNYLVHLSSQNYFMMDMHVEEKLNERVNGGNSDNDGDVERDFNDTMR